VLAPDQRLGFDVDRVKDTLADLFGSRVDLVFRKLFRRLLRDEILSQARTLYAA
jgi:predicted nucleotidyltransferase